jgi:hypothetical protein
VPALTRLATEVSTAGAACKLTPATTRPGGIGVARQLQGIPRSRGGPEGAGGRRGLPGDQG